ncbi:MAG: hypothetical protein KC414_12385, partial [Romboutsia sp.]|nr:hypothetical protein [Romboutsia sp.]
INYQGFLGIFYAHLALNTIWTLTMLIYVLNLFKWKLILPGFSQFIKYIKLLMSVGIFLYIIKICTSWLNLPEILLASQISGTLLGAYTFAYMIASKISQVSDAITDISLPSMSKVYANDNGNFKQIFKNGNGKAIYLISLVTLILVAFKIEAIKILDFLISLISPDRVPFMLKFSDSLSIINYLAIAFWGYAILNLFQAGLNIPTKKLYEVTISYIALITSTYLLFITLPIQDAILKMNISFAIGSILALVLNIILTSKKIGWLILSKNTLTLMIIFLFIVSLNIVYNNIYIGIVSILVMLIPIKKFI